MITCGDCTQRDMCNTTSESSACSDFDRGAPEDFPAVESDIKQLWTAVGMAQHSIAVLEDRMNSIISAVLKAAQDKQEGDR